MILIAETIGAKLNNILAKILLQRDEVVTVASLIQGVTLTKLVISYTPTFRV